MPDAPQSEAHSIWLVYDGDCPFCSAAAQTVRLKQAVGRLEIVNARDGHDHPVLAEAAAQGLDLNDGIVVKFEGRLYHGADALHLLALLGSQRGWLNRLNVALFRNRMTVGLAYPALKGLRNLALAVRGKRPI